MAEGLHGVPESEAGIEADIDINEVPRSVLNALRVAESDLTKGSEEGYVVEEKASRTDLGGGGVKYKIAVRIENKGARADFSGPESNLTAIIIAQNDKVEKVTWSKIGE